jgi:hypothetical protein
MAPKARPGTSVRFAAGPAAERTERTLAGLQAHLAGWAFPKGGCLYALLRHHALIDGELRPPAVGRVGAR